MTARVLVARVVEGSDHENVIEAELVDGPRRAARVRAPVARARRRAVRPFERLVHVAAAVVGFVRCYGGTDRGPPLPR